MMRMFQEEGVDINLMDNKINNVLSLSLSHSAVITMELQSNLS